MNKINLNSVAFLVLGVFLLFTPALSQAIITSLVTAFFRNIDLLLWVNLAQNFWILNLIPKVVGATLVAGFAWKHLKTRFKVDLPKIKVQTTRLATYSLLFMLCAGLFLFADVPVSEAATTATTGYILDTPVSEHAWLIGAYSDGTYYAINGGTWDNMVAGVGSTAWATYKTNSTALTAQVLAVCTSGSIYMKDVAFDMDLFDDIHEDVRVICSYNAEYWEYINSADSSGSPYTVSVGSGVNNGYTIAQDSENRVFLVSTDPATAINTPLALGGLTILSSGVYAPHSGIIVPAGAFLEGEAKGATPVIRDAGYGLPVVVDVRGGSNDVGRIGVKNIEIDGNHFSVVGLRISSGRAYYENIFVYGCNLNLTCVGIQLQGATSNTLMHIQAVGNSINVQLDGVSTGATTANFCNDNKFIGGRFAGSWSYNIMLQGLASDNKFIGVTSEGNYDVDFYFNRAENDADRQPHNTLITDSYIELDKAHDAILDGGSFNHGIYGLRVLGNTFQTAVNADLAFEFKYFKGAIVQNNVFYNGAAGRGWVIYTYAASANCYVVYNTLGLAGNLTIIDTGTNNTIIPNQTL